MELAFLLIPIVLVLVICGVYYSYLQQKKRREELRRLADELGWQFEPQSDYDHDEEYGHFEIFRRGHSRYAYNTLHGSVAVDGGNWPAKMGDFHYKVTSGSGKNRSTSTYRFSYLMLRLPYQPMPELLIRREGMFDSLASLFGFDDIDFESAEFSRRFFVKSPDKRFAYDVIHTGMMEFLLAADAPMVDIERGGCCLSDGRGTWTPHEFRATIEFASEFFRLWPQHVVAQLEHKV